jgi:hypothetical protein
VISRTTSFVCGCDRLIHRLHSPRAHMRRISTARLSTRRADRSPEQPKSWRPRGWPSASTRSSVKTSPLACDSILTVKLLGQVSPANVDRAGFICQVPNAIPAQPAAARIANALIHMRSDCAVEAQITSTEG